MVVVVFNKLEKEPFPAWMQRSEDKRHLRLSPHSQERGGSVEGEEVKMHREEVKTFGWHSGSWFQPFLKAYS